MSKLLDTLRRFSRSQWGTLVAFIVPVLWALLTGQQQTVTPDQGREAVCHVAAAACDGSQSPACSAALAWCGPVEVDVPPVGD